MPDYSFRIRFVRSPHTWISIPNRQYSLTQSDLNETVILRSINEDENVDKALDFIFESSGWESEHKAMEAGKRYYNALLTTLFRLGIGTDLEIRKQTGVITNAGLKFFEERFNQRCLRDQPGVMVYESLPKPRFLSIKGDLSINKPVERFEKLFLTSLNNPRHYTDREMLSIALFNTSSFEKEIAVRLILLVMSIEALLKRSDRPTVIIRYIDQFIKSLENPKEIVDQEDVDLLVKSLNNIRKESIRKTGIEFVRSRLGSRTYYSLDPGNFFDHCYDLRSRLVHGDIPFSSPEIGPVIQDLMKMVPDIILGHEAD